MIINYVMCNFLVDVVFLKKERPANTSALFEDYFSECIFHIPLKKAIGFSIKDILGQVKREELVKNMPFYGIVLNEVDMEFRSEPLYFKSSLRQKESDLKSSQYAITCNVQSTYFGPLDIYAYTVRKGVLEEGNIFLSSDTKGNKKHKDDLL